MTSIQLCLAPIPEIIVTDTDTNITTVLCRPPSSRLILPNNANGMTAYQIRNSRLFLAPQANKTNNVFESVKKSILEPVDDEERSAIEVLRTLEKSARKKAADVALATCIKNHARQSDEKDSRELVRNLEVAAVEAMRYFRQDQQPEKNDNISYAFHTIANSYTMLLAQVHGRDKDLLKQKIAIYFHFALEFAPNDALKAGIYFDFALYYQSQENYEQELAMWTACSKYDSGKTAYKHIGDMYLQGRGVIKNQLTALKYFLMGAEKGDHNAVCNVGLQYDTMRASSQDLQSKNEYRNLAIYAYSRLSLLPRTFCKYSDESSFRASFLSDLNENGEFTPKNINKSLSAYKQALKVDPKNYVIINVLALVTFLKNKNMKSTTALFKKAATAGSKLANSFLKLTTEKEKEAKLAEFCKAPDQIYMEET